MILKDDETPYENRLRTEQRRVSSNGVFLDHQLTFVILYGLRATGNRLNTSGTMGWPENRTDTYVRRRYYWRRTMYTLRKGHWARRWNRRRSVNVPSRIRAKTLTGPAANNLNPNGRSALNRRTQSATTFGRNARYLTPVTPSGCLRSFKVGALRRKYALDEYGASTRQNNKHRTVNTANNNINI